MAWLLAVVAVVAWLVLLAERNMPEEYATGLCLRNI
jgi:hypothetical protein